MEAGDFVYNRLFAWKGSFAVATEAEHGCYVSNEFPCFRLNDDRLVGDYLANYFRQEFVWDEALALSSGSTPTSRNRLKEADLLSLRIPLPPLAQQQEVVSDIKRLLGPLEDARRLISETAADWDRLLIALAQRDDLSDGQKEAQGWRRVRLGDVMRPDLEPTPVRPDVAYPSVGCYSFARGLFRKPPLLGMDLAADRLFRLRSGQFTYLKLKAFEGAFGWVPPELDGSFVSSEYPAFTMLDGNRAEWLFAHFKSPGAWSRLASGSKGIGARRERVNPTGLLTYEIWLPPLVEQDRIAEVLAARRSYAELDTFDADAEALRRSILAKAFRGEL